jgi:diguanylate cyclase (GGDEF)-like protein
MAQDGQTLRVEPGKWSVDVRIFSAWLVDEAQVRLRFRLAGFETEWSDLTAQPVVRYNSLPPGRYVLQAQAFAPLAGFGGVATVLTLQVAARTSWQAALGGIAAWYDDKVGLALRNRLMLERHRRLEAEVAERVSELARANEELERRRAAMEHTARTDALTGWANRRDFDERFAAELNRMARSTAPVGLLLADVDHFKRYNDRYGHPAGDDCLRQVTRAMHGQLRPYDVAARYGGEEFAIVLPGATVETVRRIGQRLCEAVQRLALPHADSPEGVVTVSIGGLSAIGGTPAELLRRADLALYAAKAAGRNRFMADDPAT